jgi:hypothetical protein
MSSLAGPSGSGGLEIPKRTSSKRGREELEKELARRELDLELARKKVRPSLSFDAPYWTLAAEASTAAVEHLLAQKKLAVRNFADSDEAAAGASWWSTMEARRIIEQLKAATYEKRLYTKQAEKVEQGGPVRRALLAMFTTSKLGIGAEKIGFGKRKQSEQARFKDSLIQFYDAGTPKYNKPKVIASVHDTATGHELVKSNIRAAHLVPYGLGADVLVALFGEDVGNELTMVRVWLRIPESLHANSLHSLATKWSSTST